MRAFWTFVRPVLEFSSVIWSRCSNEEINEIVAVQRSFTNAIGNLRFLRRERLFNLKLDCLRCRRLKADLIMCYKTLHGLLDIELLTLPLCCTLFLTYTVAIHLHQLNLLFFLTEIIFGIPFLILLWLLASPLYERCLAWPFWYVSVYSV